MPEWKTFLNPDRLLAVPRSHCPARTTHGPIQDHFSNRPPLPPKLPDTPHSDSEKKEWWMPEKASRQDSIPFWSSTQVQQTHPSKHFQTTFHFREAHSCPAAACFFPVYFLGIVPGWLAGLVTLNLSLYSLGQKQGGCSSKVYIPPIENIFLVTLKNTFSIQIPVFPNPGRKFQKHRNPCISSPRLLPRNRPRLMAGLVTFNLSPIVLGKNMGVCSSLFHISP